MELSWDSSNAQCDNQAEKAVINVNSASLLMTHNRDSVILHNSLVKPTYYTQGTCYLLAVLQLRSFVCQLYLQ